MNSSISARNGCTSPVRDIRDTGSISILDERRYVSLPLTFFSTVVVGLTLAYGGSSLGMYIRLTKVKVAHFQFGKSSTLLARDIDAAS
jgi:small basic protein